MIRVAVIDNDRLVPAGLRTLLAETEGGHDVEVVSTATNVAALRATGTRVLVFSVHGDRRHIRATIRAGAGGYLIKDDDPPELSAQELQVLYLYGTGSTLAATARRLGIAIPTVRSYLDRIRAKWAAADEPVDDVRALIHEYHPRTETFCALGPWTSRVRLGVWPTAVPGC